MDVSVEALLSSSYFRDLEKHQLEKVADIATVQNLKKGATLMKEGDRGDSIFLIQAGRVEVSVSLVGQDRSEVIATLGVGELIGEMILLGKNRRSATVSAKDDIEILTWRVGDLTKLFESDLRIGFTVMKNIAKQMSERLIASNQVLRNALIVTNSPIY